MTGDLPNLQVSKQRRYRTPSFPINSTELAKEILAMQRIHKDRITVFHTRIIDVLAVGVEFEFSLFLKDPHNYNQLNTLYMCTNITMLMKFMYICGWLKDCKFVYSIGPVRSPRARVS